MGPTIALKWGFMHVHVGELGLEPLYHAFWDIAQAHVLAYGDQNVYPAVLGGFDVTPQFCELVGQLGVELADWKAEEQLSSLLLM